jgi:hypothetical protein
MLGHRKKQIPRNVKIPFNSFCHFDSPLLRGLFVPEHLNPIVVTFPGFLKPPQSFLPEIVRIPSNAGCLPWIPPYELIKFLYQL